MKTNMTIALLKIGALLGVVALFPAIYMIPVAVTIILTYQYVIAAIFKVTVMPTMDLACFFGHDNANVNFMSYTIVEKFEFKVLRENFYNQMKTHKKLRSGITEILGDLYWKELDADKYIDHCFAKVPKEFKNQKDIQDFIEKDINNEMPFDKPQWRMYMQENYQEKYSIIFYKQHHSMCDGVSCMSHHLTHGVSTEFDTTKLFPIKKLSFFERMQIRLAFPFRALFVIKKLAVLKQDINPLHDGKRKLTGVKKAATSSDLKFQDIKAASKKQKCTINDLVTACTATALKEYFELKGDKETNQVNIVVPANIRFGHYENFETMKFENKFAPVPLTIPLDSDLTKSIQKVSKVTSQLRSQFLDIYATYAMSFYSIKFTPNFLSDWFIKKSTMPYTLAFSNVPGLLRPLEQDGKKSVLMCNYLIPSGHTGLAIGAISYSEYFKITCVSDSAIMTDPQVLLDMVEKNLKACYDTERKDNPESENSSPTKTIE
eukprot:403360388